MGILKYRSDWPSWFDDAGWPWSERPSINWTYRGTWVDTEKFDIIPKPGLKKELIEQKQKEIDKLDEQRKRLEQEIKELKA